MEEILILGSLPSNKEEENLYERIIHVCKNYVKKVSSPIDTSKFEGDNEQKYERALKKVKNADLIIGDQTKPSTGQGIEIGYSTFFNKPILVTAKEGSKISGLIKGCPHVKNILYYDSLEDLDRKLSQSLEDLIY